MNSEIYIFAGKLWSHLASKRRIQFGFLLILIIFSSIFEMLSIGAVFPFLLVLSTPDVLFEYEIIRQLFLFIGINDPRDSLWIITVLFCCAILLAGLFRLLTLYSINFISYVTCADIGVIAVNRTLKQPYAVHTSRNSSELINSVVVKVNTVLQSVVLPGLTLISSVLTGLGILVVISIVSFQISMTVTIILGIIYSFFIKLTKKRVAINGRDIAIKSTRVIKLLQESFGGIRDIILDNAQNFHSQMFKKAELELRFAQASNSFIGASPRFIIEPFGIILIAGIAYQSSLSSTGSGISSIVPTLGALALGFQRLLPVLQQTYASVTSIRGSHQSFSDVISLLDQEVDDESDNYSDLNEISRSLFFQRTLELKNINYSYAPGSPSVLEDINIEINKGSNVGIIGETGSGKSTLIDIIMSLLSPTYGYLEVDGKKLSKDNLKYWRSLICHVPQSIFLTDSSIAENIALNIPKENIDFERLNKVVKQAQLSKLIDSWPDKLQTMIGERGIRLSGGQRQRIGIARALYKKSEVMILDEATSALDNKTERLIMKEINNLEIKPTVIIVAHRYLTLESCDQIIEVKNGRLELHGDYENFKNMKINLG